MHHRPSARLSTLLVTLGLLVAACGGGSSDDAGAEAGGGGSGGSSAKAGAGGTGAKAGGAGASGSATGGSAGNGGPAGPWPAGLAGQGCPDDPCPDFTACVIASCRAEHATCFGEGFEKGSFSGPCATYAACQAKCGCDQDCQDTCAADIDEACEACNADTIGACRIAKCQAQLDACEGEGGASGQGGQAGQGGAAGSAGQQGGAGGSSGQQGGASGQGGAGGGASPTACDDAKQCCSTLDPQSSDECTAKVTAAAGDAKACAAIVAGYEAEGVCD